METSSNKAHTDANIAGSISPADDTDGLLRNRAFGARTIRKHRGAATAQTTTLPGPVKLIFGAEMQFAPKVGK